MPDCAAARGEAPWNRGAAREWPRVPGVALPPVYRCLKGNAMSSKAHLRAQKRQQRGSRNYVVALLLALLFLLLLVLAVAMVSSGHGIPPGVR
jgi:hypothetical protein